MTRVLKEKDGCIYVLEARFLKYEFMFLPTLAWAVFANGGFRIDAGFMTFRLRLCKARVPAPHNMAAA